MYLQSTNNITLLLFVPFFLKTYGSSLIFKTMLQKRIIKEKKTLIGIFVYYHGHHVTNNFDHHQNNGNKGIVPITVIYEESVKITLDF